LFPPLLSLIFFSLSPQILARLSMSTSRKVVDPSFDKSHHISIESVGRFGTEDGNTRLDTTKTKQSVIEKYGRLY
jgi:hypothetical protein